MVSYKNYNLNVNEDFVMFLTSKLITCFIDGFTSGMKSRSIASLLIGNAHIYVYIGFQTLKMKCAQYGICSQAPSKNARAICFSKLGGAGNNFRSGLEISLEGCPNYVPLPWKVRGGCLMST